MYRRFLSYLSGGQLSRRYLFRLCIWGAVWLLALAMPAMAQVSGPPAVSVRLDQPNSARFPNVTLYAYPVDARGLLVAGLHADDFQVTENGRRAEISKVETEGGSLDVCLALDRSPSMLDEGKFIHARAAAHEFLGQLGPADRASLVSFAAGSTLDQSLTLDHGAVADALDRARVSGDTTTFLDAVYWSIAQVSLSPQGPTSLTAAASSGRPDARRVVLAITDGLDLSSRVTVQELLDHARAGGVSLCMVALGSDASRAQMEYLANQSGGIYVYAPTPKDLESLYASLAQQLRREYRLTIRSPRPERDGTRRNVRLTLGSVSGDAWYTAPVQGTVLSAGNSAGGTSAAGNSATAASGSGPSGSGAGRPVLLLGLGLTLLGLVGACGAFLLWLRSRGTVFPVRDSNPRMDLLPLWVKEGATRVGRGAECEVVLDSHQVSRVHAVIEVAHGRFQVRDEGSSNGTYVNGRRVRSHREVKVGDHLRFGDREFRLAGSLPEGG